MPRDRTRKPVALATIDCSQLILVPSAKLVTIAGFCPHRSAQPCWVVGFRYGSWRPLTLPTTRGVRPSPRTQRTRLSWTPGSSPSQADMMTPCSRAFTWRMGPIVASSSAFMSTTSLPWANASRTTWVAYSTAPVASTMTSTSGARASRRASVVIAVAPPATASASPSADSAVTACRPAYSTTWAARSSWRPATATSRMPATLLAIWLARPWAMNPAPTIPTRIGVPAASSSRSAVSTRITVSPPPSGPGHPARRRRAAPSPDPWVRPRRSAAARRSRVGGRRTGARPPGPARRTR